MKTFYTILTCLIFSTQLFAKPETEKLLKVLNMETTQKETIKQIIKTQIAQNPKIALIEKEYIEFMQKTVGWKSIKNDIVKI